MLSLKTAMLLAKLDLNKITQITKHITSSK
jgi:hypothetical protein